MKTKREKMYSNLIYITEKVIFFTIIWCKINFCSIFVLRGDYIVQLDVLITKQNGLQS
ncbi:unnamed protein product [Larinioides sclopetarius]|uniref:Uncharacterized protein n=1 Tax=Larinioides sclopetarius TaxID=280406 RepID=A0AAV2BVK4_9ARAC